MKWQLFVAALTLAVTAFGMEARIIGGTKVVPSDFPWVKKITVEGAGCTASVVGPKVLLTAAHCVRNGMVGIQLDGDTASGEVIRHPSWPGKDIDIAVIIVSDRDANLLSGIEAVTPAGTLAIGDEVQQVGYGCTKSGGVGGLDGNMYYGTATVRYQDPFNHVTIGNALCFGDSGGPAFVKDDAGQIIQVGIASKGNLKTDSYYTRLDVVETNGFLNQVATSKGVEICGINADCR